MRNEEWKIAQHSEGHLEVTFSLKPEEKKNGKPVQDDQVECRVGNIPRISKLMALAIHFDDRIRKGELQDYAQLAELGRVTRARMTQIMNLLNLAPDIQEQILFLPRTVKGHDPVKERDLRAIASVPFWGRQRRMWKKLIVCRHP